MPLPPTGARRSSRLLLGVLVALLAALLPSSVSAHQRPHTIPLPNGFAPEDITAGPGHTFFVGSLSTGGIYKGSFRTGKGALLVPSADGPTTGLYLERKRGHDRLWAAGGPTGQARVYDASTGKLLRTYHLADPSSGTFASDVIVTHRAAYYTDAFVQQLYVIPFGRHHRHHHGDDGDDRHAGDRGDRGHHRLPGQKAVRTVPLSGDVHYDTRPNTFNLNGLAALHGRLVSAQTVTGELFRINPRNGVTRMIRLTDKHGKPATVPGADGIAQRGRTLFLAENFPEKLATVKLARDLRSARLVDLVGDPALDIPSSVEEDSGDLFGLNARFGTPVTPTTTYDIVRVHR
jgi:hypothetical protein